MSLTMIAMTGILLGFLCLMVGFFMEGTEPEAAAGPKRKGVRPHKKRAPRRKAA